MTSPDCIFCRIVERSADALLIHEDDRTISFLALEPAISGHTVLAPKAHYADVYTIPEDLLSDLMKPCQAHARRWREQVGASGSTSCTPAGSTPTNRSVTVIFTCFHDSRATESELGPRSRGRRKRVKKCTPSFDSTRRRALVPEFGCVDPDVPRARARIRLCVFGIRVVAPAQACRPRSGDPDDLVAESVSI
jgi:hypothetical protein